MLDFGNRLGVTVRKRRVRGMVRGQGGPLCGNRSTAGEGSPPHREHDAVLEARERQGPGPAPADAGDADRCETDGAGEAFRALGQLHRADVPSHPCGGGAASRCRLPGLSGVRSGFSGGRSGGSRLGGACHEESVRPLLSGRILEVSRTADVRCRSGVSGTPFRVQIQEITQPGVVVAIAPRPRATGCDPFRIKISGVL